ncbi:GH92 family glycosyl hydrolase [Vagococcus sp. PNs007]|uniref:GH92 family glycosyl hydrolase n=1 Tax=Vagococcus proximus TaxID=2991417 RepID=A0ABT5X070_9ENTE|nr:GH92 family glycosyl hydrolase [Vagococcus proximus]MDF0479379.1 GH92 family glycosyl hydrolase [Vagococcus proximus]
MLIERDLLKIDTRQGTNNQHSYSNGNCLPYTAVPFGMNHFVMQTADQRGSWYFNPHDRVFQGFRLTHQPSPWMGDFSHMVFNPISGELPNQTTFFAQSSYRPEEAVFAPHYNKVRQERYQITSELVPTLYGAKIKSSYRYTDNKGMIVTSPGRYKLTIDLEKNELSGYIINFSGAEDPDFKMYLSVTFNRKLSSTKSGFFIEDKLSVVTENEGDDLQLMLRFEEGETVETTLATSFISVEQARLNRERMMMSDFEETKANAAAKWLDYLNRIEVEDKDETKVHTFYNILYRSFLFPQTFYELDKSGNEIHYDTLSQTIKPGKLFSNNGFWDTYKTVYPLYSLIAQDEYEDMLEGFLNSYHNNGFLPKWLSPDERGLMPGTLVDAVIADAAVKGIGEKNMPEFLEAMIKAAQVQSDNPNYGRRGTNQYNELGYVSSEFGESVNHTQDYAYSDFCIAQVAKTLGKEGLVEEYLERSHNYRNIFDKEVGFMRAKNPDGTFVEEFHPFNWGKHYTEGSAWQNSFAVFHDFADLIELHGGKEVFTEKLIELCNTYPEFNVTGYGFEIHEMSEMAAVNFGQVAMSNQPSFHIPYLFNYVNQPMYTQLLVKNIKDNLFNAGFDGFPGDEDNGSMATWYVFSCLGFYPVCPGSGEYTIGNPSFDKVTLHLSNGKALEIQTTHHYDTHHFVGKVEQGGKVVNPLAITHDALMTGEKVSFDMTLVPPLPKSTYTNLPFSVTK